jgi:hypothetical protein
MTKFCDDINWTNICTYQVLSESFITTFKEKVDWKKISQYQVLSSSFIISDSCAYLSKFDWNLISKYQVLEENYITALSSSVNWDLISQYQVLSEEFIDTHNISVNWNKIIQFQDLSESFTTTYPEYKSVILECFKRSDGKPIISFCKLIAATKYISSGKTDILSIIDNSSSGSSMLNILDRDHNWLYINSTTKENRVNKFYTVVTISSSSAKWVECYKAVNYDYTNIYKGGDSFLYNRLDKVYKTECNFMDTVNNAQGFSCWTLDNVKLFATSIHIYEYKIIKVMVPLEAMCMLSNGKIRASQMIIMEL